VNGTNGYRLEKLAPGPLQYEATEGQGIILDQLTTERRLQGDFSDSSWNRTSENSNNNDIPTRTDAANSK